MSWDDHFRKLHALDEADPAKVSMTHQFLDSLGREFLEGHRIEQSGESEVEMRATWKAIPVRAKIDTNFGLLEWEMKAPNPTTTTLAFAFDEDAIPKAGSFSGGASVWDDDPKEKQKVFFARGFYVEATKRELPRVLAVHGALPPEVRAALVTHMKGEKIHRLFIYDRGTLLMTWRDGLHELGDAYYKAARGVWLLGQLAHGIARVNPSTLPTGAAPEGAPLACGFCKTRFLLQENATCPNCGAPPR